MTRKRGCLKEAPPMESEYALFDGNRQLRPEPRSSIATPFPAGTISGRKPPAKPPDSPRSHEGTTRDHEDPPPGRRAELDPRARSSAGPPHALRARKALLLPEGDHQPVRGGQGEGAPLQRDDRHRDREGRAHAPRVAPEVLPDRSRRSLSLRSHGRKAGAPRGLEGEAGPREPEPAREEDEP